MKHLLLSILTIATFTAFGQPPQGSTLIAGGICFDTWNSETTSGSTTVDGPTTSDFKASIFAQNLITPRISVGGGVQFEGTSLSSSDEFGSSDYSENIFSVKAGGRYWMGCEDEPDDDPVHPWIGAGVGIGFGSGTTTSTFSGETNTSEDKISTFNAGIRLGVVYDLNDWLSIGVSTGQIGLRSQTYSQDDFSQTDRWFTGKASLKEPRFSLNYFMGRTEPA